jgi:hypothetical protein
MEAVQLGLALMPSKIEELYIDQVKFLPFMYADDTYQYSERWNLKTPDQIRKMDSDYCQRVQNQAYSPEIVKRDLLEDVPLAEKCWKEYYKKYAKIYKSKHGTLIFVDNTFEKSLKQTQKDTDEMLKFVGESPESLREEIICNPHLHPCIKENLLGNLDRILSDKNEY